MLGGARWGCSTGSGGAARCDGGAGGIAPRPVAALAAGGWPQAKPARSDRWAAGCIGPARRAERASPGGGMAMADGADRKDESNRGLRPI